MPSKNSPEGEAPLAGKMAAALSCRLRRPGLSTLLELITNAGKVGCWTDQKASSLALPNFARRRIKKSLPVSLDKYSVTVKVELLKSLVNH